MRFEGLETREMLAGDVAVHISGSTIDLNEVASQVGAANYITVSQLSNGNIRIDGVGHNLIDGAAFKDFIVPAGGPSIVADFGGGNDHVRILPGTHLASLNVDLGADVDTVDINGLTTTGAVQISTGAGVDNVFVQNSKIGDGIGQDDLTINTGAGIDYVKVGSFDNYQEIKGSLRITTFASASENEIDRVEVDLTTVRDYVQVTTGAGDDVVSMTAVTAGQQAVIQTMDGNDTVNLRDCTAIDHFYLLLGAGDDTLNTHLYVDAGTGYDRLNHYYDGPVGNTTYVGFEEINGVKLFNKFNGTGIPGTIGMKA